MAASDLQAQTDDEAEAAAMPPAPSLTKEEPNPVTEYMKRLDKDGDGALSDEERAAAKELMMKEAPPFPAGRGPGAGPFPGREGPEQFKRRMLEMFDTNKDGKLDDTERAAAEKFMAERGMGPGNMRQEIIKRFDKNGNGRIDEDERPAVEAFMRQRMASMRGPDARKAVVNPNVEMEKVVRAAVEANAAQLKRFDANQDGKLDDAEWAAARKELHVWSAEKASTPVTPGAAAATPVEEQKRLERVATEVERRRMAREQAQQKVDAK